MKRKPIASVVQTIFGWICLSVLFLFMLQSNVLSNEPSIFDLPLEELMKIAIATKTETPIEEAPSIVSVITGKEIKNMGAENIIDVLMTIPGVNISHSIFSIYHHVDMRGISNEFSSKVKFQINGHSVYGFIETSSVNNLLDMLPVNNIDKIEIIRGPGSALYGHGAFSGVINIVTKEGGKEPSNVSFAAGSNHTYHPSFEVSLKNENNANMYIYGAYYKTDGNDATIESDMTTADPFFDGIVPGEMTSGVNNYTFQTKMNLDRFYFQGFLNKIFDTEIPIGAAKALTNDSDFEFLAAFGEIGYELPISDKGSVTLKTYYDYTKRDTIYNLFPNKTGLLHNDLIESGAFGPPESYNGFPFPVGVELSAYAPSEGAICGGEVSADYQLQSWIRVVGGVSYEQMRNEVGWEANYNPTGVPIQIGGVNYAGFPYTWFGDMVDVSYYGINYFTDPKVDRNIAAIYGQGIIDLKALFGLDVSSLSLTAGFRYDDYDDVGDTTNPRIGLAFAPTEKLYFKGLYGEAFRAPSFAELYTAANQAITGSTDIKPEKMKTIEGLVGYNLSSAFRTSITFFNLRIDEVIQKSAAASSTAGALSNFGVYESNGFEAELKYTFGQNRYAFFNATYQDVKNTTNEVIQSGLGRLYTQKDFFPGNIPEFFGNIGFNYDPFDWIVGNITINYIGDKDRTDEMTWDGESLVKKDRRGPVDAVTLVHATLTFPKAWKTMDVQLNVQNILDENYRLPDPDGVIANDFPCPGRTFTAKVSYEFLEP